MTSTGRFTGGDHGLIVSGAIEGTAGSGRDSYELNQYIRRALDTEALLGALEAARADLVPIARAKGVYTDDDVFTIVEPHALPEPVCRNADDDLALGTAVAADAAFIVTGDQDLLALGTYASVGIVSPRQFLERLEASRVD